LRYGSVSTAEPVARLIEELSKLPGIGPKSAQRLTYFLLRVPESQAKALAEAIIAIKEQVVLCSICQNVSEQEICSICQNNQRDRTRICVVEEPLNMLIIERTQSYKGLYHVLHGVISPMDGIGPDDLKIKELIARLKDNSVEEVIIATNPNLEGQATATYLQRIINPFGVEVTGLALGLPYGCDMDYADEVTLTHALDKRQII